MSKRLGKRERKALKVAIAMRHSIVQRNLSTPIQNAPSMRLSQMSEIYHHGQLDKASSFRPSAFWNVPLSSRVTAKLQEGFQPYDVEAIKAKLRKRG